MTRDSFDPDDPQPQLPQTHPPACPAALRSSCVFLFIILLVPSCSCSLFFIFLFVSLATSEICACAILLIHNDLWEEERGGGLEKSACGFPQLFDIVDSAVAMETEDG